MTAVGGVATQLVSQTLSAGPSQQIHRPSGGAGPDAQRIDRFLDQWSGNTTTSTTQSEETLASTRFLLKEKFASLAMHLDADTRKRVYSQLDRLLHSEDWEPEDVLPNMEAWRSLWRLMIFLKPFRMPGISFRDGNAVAVWVKEDIRITVECRPADAVNWVASRLVEGEREVTVGDAPHSSRLRRMLSAYNDGDWLFANER